MIDIVDNVLPYAFIFLVFTMLIAVIVMRIRERINNNNSPILSVSAKIVAKRIKTRLIDDDTLRHYYRITFEMQSGERKEMKVTEREFGLLVEGDEGVLSFQGTRYLGFERKH